MDEPNAKQIASHILLKRSMTSFDRYFEMGGEESASPFLNDVSKRLSRNIHLKSSIIAACSLAAAGILSFFSASAAFEFVAILLAIVYMLSGTPALVSSLEDVFIKRDVNIDVLMTLSAFAALAIGHAYEGALLLVLFALSGSLEEMVTLKAKSALTSIHEIAPSKCCIVRADGSVVDKSVHDVGIGADILVRAGEIVPLDGLVIAGAGSLSSAHLTGESIAKPVHANDPVVSGSRLTQGSITVRVTTTRGDSTVMKIIRLITEAEKTKPQYSQWFDRFGRIYSLSVIGITLSLLCIFPKLLSVPLFGSSGALVRSISFLITASPCALFIAVPIAYLSALSAAVRRGAILKGGAVFDALGQCATVAFDKTGTLTRGVFEFRSFHQIGRVNPLQAILSEDAVVMLVAAVERHVVHPIAQAIVAYAEGKKLQPLSVSSVKVYQGVGVEGIASFEGRPIRVHIRSPSESDERQIRSYFEEHRAVVPGAASSVVVDIEEKDSKDTFLFLFEDALREESVETVHKLISLGKKVLMLSGDRPSVCSTIAEQAGISDWRAGLKPEEKLRMVEALSLEGGLVMVGDGMNDAPALARANIGISMGKISSASARDASDVVLLEDRLPLIPWLFIKARATRRIVRQNLTLASLSISIGTVSSLAGFLPLWLAVIIHEGSTLLVGLNALRLLRQEKVQK